MENLKYEYPAEVTALRRAHIGVVGSGDLEILLEPTAAGIATVEIVTRFDGNREIWEAVLSRFFDEHPIAARIKINDFGATPGLAGLRMLQVLEECLNEASEE